MTQPSPQEAREILAEVDEVARKMRNTLAAGAMAPNLIIWGIVWAVAFTATYFYTAAAPRIWLVLTMLGMVASAITAIRECRRRIVLSASERRVGKKLFAFWLAVFAYATLMVYILKPHYGPDFVCVFVLFAMMGYIIMGLWLNSLPLAIVGIFVTIFTVLGRVTLTEPQFLLWMAGFGGGGLFVPGLYIQLRWR